jgi:hypothetical protein
MNSIEKSPGFHVRLTRRLIKNPARFALVAVCAQERNVTLL